jgi:HTH-type transcriptional regulator/antitoxin HigA
MALQPHDRPQPGADNRRYLALVRKHPLRPIRSEDELDRAIVMVDSLIARGVLDDGERDYLLVLGRLVEDYEKEAQSIGPVSDAVMLRFLIDSNRVTQAAVAARTGIAESTVSEVLAGKKALRRQQLAAVAGFFRVSPDVFSLALPTEARSKGSGGR